MRSDIELHDSELRAGRRCKEFGIKREITAVSIRPSTLLIIDAECRRLNLSRGELVDSWADKITEEAFK